MRPDAANIIRSSFTVRGKYIATTLKRGKKFGISDRGFSTRSGDTYGQRPDAVVADEADAL